MEITMKHRLCFTTLGVVAMTLGFTASAHAVLIDVTATGDFGTVIGGGNPLSIFNGQAFTTTARYDTALVDFFGGGGSGGFLAPIGPLGASLSTVGATPATFTAGGEYGLIISDGAPVSDPDMFRWEVEAENGPTTIAISVFDPTGTPFDPSTRVFLGFTASIFFPDGTIPFPGQIGGRP